MYKTRHRPSPTFLILNMAALGGDAGGVERNTGDRKVGEGSDELFFSMPDSLSNFQRALVEISRSLGYP